MRWPPRSPEPEVPPIVAEPRVGTTACGGETWTGLTGEWVSDICGPFRPDPCTCQEPAVIPVVPEQRQDKETA